MSKLDEIEALIYTREDLQHDEEPVYLAQDVRLLIKAVRQLGAEFSTTHEHCPDDCAAQERVSNDVLKLIGGKE